MWFGLVTWSLRRVVSHLPSTRTDSNPQTTKLQTSKHHCYHEKPRMLLNVNDSWYCETSCPTLLAKHPAMHEPEIKSHAGLTVNGGARSS